VSTSLDAHFRPLSRLVQAS
jgi:hypothetical protein